MNIVESVVREAALGISRAIGLDPHPDDVDALNKLNPPRRIFYAQSCKEGIDITHLHAGRNSNQDTQATG